MIRPARPMTRPIARRAAWALAALALIVAACSGSGGDSADATSNPDELVRLNEIQVMGTHNSYRVRPPAPLFESLLTAAPERAAELDYAHRPLDEQFTQLGARQIELDVYPDPDGGRYAIRNLNEGVGLPAAAPEPEMRAPGSKVLHIDDIDYASTCLTFVACLTEVRDWSTANPSHLPIMILVEVKTPTFGAPAPITAADLDTLDAEIRSVFSDDQVITPDAVRGAAASLREAVTTTGWPTLAESRGKVLFGLDNGGEVRDLYAAGRPSLDGRVMFASMETTDDPAAAFFKRNEPLGEGQVEIADLVRQGFIVRTRSDVPVVQVAANDRTQLEAALASGAQYISSDYLEPDLDYSEYVASLPGGVVARCNPVATSPDCDDTVLAGDLTTG